MNFIPLKNPRLIKYLQNITDLLYRDDYRKLISKVRPQVDSLIPRLYPCSDEYLYKAQQLKLEEYGFPRSSLGLGMKEYNPELLEVIDPIAKITGRIGSFLGSYVNALTMAYPDKGYIGWHHNGNASGYNILMTYSQDGDGCFKYFDRKNNQIITLKDEPGWTVKVGYYPNQRTQSDRVYWHCAETKKQRISVAWVLDHRDMWENMINTISDGEYDKKVLFQDQMNVTQ